MTITMKPVDFGKRSGLKVYPVSIGGMRLPEEEKAIPLIRQAIDSGMIYIDTSRGYGDSEIKIGKALKDGYREKVILSTKWCPWNIKIEEDDDTSADCMYKRILECMQRLDVEYLDFYQIWSINTPDQYKQATEKGGMLDGIFRAMKEGLVKHTGLTTHDKPENLSRYIDEADWCETILFTHNILNPDYKDVIAKAHEKGIATIIMNPIAGGLLDENSPVLKQTAKVINDAENLVEVAHRYLAGDKNIDTILCGIAKPSDITSTIKNYSKKPLTEKERNAVELAMKNLTKEGFSFCTSCGYCMPCPQGINIPQMMHVAYLQDLLQVAKLAKKYYDGLVSEKNPTCSPTPDKCTACGKCEDKCTQKLKITEVIKSLTEKFCQK